MRIIFICTGNAGRSQLAEGFVRQKAGAVHDVASAGVMPWNDIHPMTRRIFRRRGIAVDGHVPKPVPVHEAHSFDVVVTIGTEAGRMRPLCQSGIRRVHWDVEDPAEGPEHEEQDRWQRVEQRIDVLTDRLLEDLS